MQKKLSITVDEEVYAGLLKIDIKRCKNKLPEKYDPSADMGEPRR